MARLTRASIVPSLKQGLKVGLASLLTYAAARSVGLPSPYIGVVTAVIVLQAYVADSLQMAAYRMTGTLVGALISLLLLAAAPAGDAQVGLLLFVALVFCGFLTTYAPQFRMAAITVAIVFLMGVGSEDWLAVALDRVLEIALGIACAVLVSLVVWPQRASALLRGTLGEYFMEAGRLAEVLNSEFLEAQRPGGGSSAAALDALLARARELAGKAIAHEARLYPQGGQEAARLMAGAERVRDHLYAMSAALAAQSGEPERFIIEPEMRALATDIRAALESRAARAANPEQVAAVAHSLARADARLAELRGLGTTRRFDLPKLAQFFAFYHALRGLGEALGRE